MEKDSCTHSRYSPATASATLSQMARGAFLWRKIPAMGTMTMYRAVMKPALPEEVVSSPICWRLVATVSAVPQHRPPNRRSRRVPGRAAASPRKSRRLRRRSSRHSTSRNTKATALLAAVKVKGPTWSAPTLWATKAVPQIRAASTGNTF